MLNKVRDLKKESKGVKAAGFTIIEVMIVLAIAGLIMAIVFLAIPALQRNNRNTQRKADASRLAGLINDYVTNNNGTLPTGFDIAAPLVAGHLSLVTENFSILKKSAGAAGPPVVAANPSLQAYAAITAPNPDVFVVETGASCGGTNTPAANTSVRAFVVYYGIEGTTATQCLES